jgi:hypothetical protein
MLSTKTNGMHAVLHGPIAKNFVLFSLEKPKVLVYDVKDG